MSSNLDYDANHNLKHRRKFCLGLHAAVRDPVGHRERIDEAFAPFLIALIPDKVRVDEDVVRIETCGISFIVIFVVAAAAGLLGVPF
jgi:hypothetical protein